MDCRKCIWDQNNITKCEECVHNPTRRTGIPAVDNFKESGEYYIGEEITFKRGEKRFTGKIKNFLTKEQSKQCNMWYCPIEVELEDGSIMEIADYEIVI